MEAAGRTNLNTGSIGENLAVKFLRSRGYQILERNYRTPLGETDIVAQRGGCLVFFEVKTRYTDMFGPPLSAITWQKQKHIIRNCLIYLKRRGLVDALCRIDVIGITLTPNGELESLEHVKDAIQIENY